jgi:alpha-L-fucosidase 2
MGDWSGMVFTHGSLVASRARRGEMALTLLELYKKAFIYPNGFHVNGDYRQVGLTQYTYASYTTEAECAFTAAVNEMLLQSWGGRLRIFPAVPAAWKDIAFRNFRAEGGVLVSAEMRRGEIISASVESEKGGEAKLVWPLGYVAPGASFEVRAIRLKPNERRELVLK